MKIASFCGQKLDWSEHLVRTRPPISSQSYVQMNMFFLPPLLPLNHRKLILDPFPVVPDPFLTLFLTLPDALQRENLRSMEGVAP